MRLTALASLFIAATALSACATRPHYGVATHTDPVSGDCDHSRTVTVGASLDLSGPQRSLGSEYLTGIRMAISQFNDTQGILKNHSCLELLYKDDRGDTNIGDKATLDLVNNEVVNLLVGPFDSATVERTGADLGLAGVPNTEFSSLNRLHNPTNYPMTFPTKASAATESSVIAAYARSRHWSSVAVAAVDDPAGRQSLAGFKSDARRDGLTVSGTVLFKAGGAPAASAVQRLQGSQAAGLAVLGDTTAVGDLLAARTAAGWDVPTVAGQIASDQAVAARAGSGVSVVAPTAAVTTSPTFNPSARDFAAKLKLRSGSIVAYAAAYDGVSMLAYAANSINSIHAGDIRTFLENANYQGLLASYGYTSSRHTGVSPEQLTVVPLSALSGGLFTG